MPRMIDAAKYILSNAGEMSAMKLQKLMYYSQAWSLVWEEEALFEEDFEAWANGPVIPALYARHRGKFLIDAAFADEGDVGSLNADQRETIDKILEFYGSKNAQTLSNLTHQEAPWLNARGDLAPMAPSSAVITKASMHEYYSSL